MKFHPPARPKAPPAHVPTLTEVVAEAPAERLAPAGAEQAQADVLANNACALQAAPPEAMPPEPDSAKGHGVLPEHHTAFAGQGKTPAAAQAQPLDNPVQGQGAALWLPENPGSARLWPPDVLEEAVVHRVMQRVDIGLEQRLRDAIATVVQEQTRSLLPRLREEVESVVRQVVYEAVADEVAADPARKTGQG